jgi:malonyl CoA-acyl carrier protein transacylase
MNENLGTAFAFPGMGIRLTGFERALFIRHRERMLPFLTEASDTAGKDLVSVLEHDTVAGQDLDDRNSQIFTFAFSAALFEVLMDNGVSAHYMAGYSFGHYAALFATHCLPFSAALSCAGRAYDIMRESCPDGRWGMAVVVGLPQAEMEDLLTGSITLVNVNSDTCVILAGSVDDLGLLRGRAMDRGALRAEMLPVTIPYHSPAILSNASEKLRTYLKTLPWNAPAVPIV